MRRTSIYIAVIVAMIASIAVAGFVGPIMVSVALGYAERRQRKSARKM